MQVFEVLLPRRCGVCGRIGESICEGCLRSFVHCAPPCCERCGAPCPWPVRRCVECAGRRVPFASARAALVYESRARAFVAAWKERGRRDLSRVAARLVAETIPRPDVDAIAYVPGDRDRSLRRGHTPAEALARELSAVWSIPHRDLLVRRPGIERQRNLPLSERRRNVANAFTGRASAPLRVCLVDDVYTTGSTVAACAGVLRHGGSRHVEVVCLARAVR